ncbi:MAG TPA: 4a-hydroxytetrahydrobiopterin dehydratase [Pyrinomonadaceae bacterium]|nr:4a-hydroxytetrahydrobiopterin dehydratase [Pyrinomonadaceae bacterium]
MKREKLTREEVNERLKDVAGWTIADGKLTRRFEFKNFAESLGFVNKVGALAEAADHHPDIKFGWGYAEFEITTHDRGGLTDFDFALAREIDRI